MSDQKIAIPSNPLRGEVTLKFGQDSYRLIPSFNNLVTIEQQTGLGLIELATLMQDNQLPLEKIVEILLSSIEPKLSSSDLRKLLEAHGIATTYEALAHFLVAVFSAGSSEGVTKKTPGKLDPSHG